MSDFKPRLILSSCNISSFRHQASEMTSALKAKVKSAATLLQQRKMLQRNLRSLQQHSFSREILSSYRSRLHSVPPPEVVKSLSPFVNERMRKRRCFADKELEMVMFERERQSEINNHQLAFHQAQRKALLERSLQQCQTKFDIGKSKVLLGNMAPRDFLQRVFPTHNPNLLELVWQGCGGNLERAIEQLASGMKTTAPIIAALRSNINQTGISSTHPLSTCHSFSSSQAQGVSSVLFPMSDPASTAKFFSVYPLVFTGPVLLNQSARSSSSMQQSETGEDFSVKTRGQHQDICRSTSSSRSEHVNDRISHSPIQLSLPSTSFGHHRRDLTSPLSSHPSLNVTDMSSPSSSSYLSSSSLSSPELELDQSLDASLSPSSWRAASEISKTDFLHECKTLKDTQFQDIEKSQILSHRVKSADSYPNDKKMDKLSVPIVASKQVTEEHSEKAFRKGPILKFSVEAIMSRT